MAPPLPLPLLPPRRSPPAEESRKKPPQRRNSFHGSRPAPPAAAAAADQQHRQMRRPRTQPNLLSSASAAGTGGLSPTPPMTSGEKRPQPAKVLVNVTVQRSLGPVHVMASTEWSVHDLVAAAVRLYVIEGRRPLLPTTSPSDYGLHYSQFSLERLDPTEKLVGLGSRNFFLCPKSVSDSAVAAAAHAPSTSSSYERPLSAAAAAASMVKSRPCSEEAARASKKTITWLRFMDFLL